MLDLVERVSPEPRCELFARRARFGWDYPIGDQALGGSGSVSLVQPPTDEQLSNFVKATVMGEARRRQLDMLDPELAAQMVLNTPWMKKEWLKRHRELQEAINDAR